MADTHISLMLAVHSAASAADWYQRALGARELRNLGSVVGLAIDDPDSFIQRAVTAGADGSADRIKDHEAPWGVHR